MPRTDIPVDKNISADKKTDSSIKDISTAAIRRSSIDLDKWARTKLINDFPLDIKPTDDELPVVYLFIDNNNWTLITTRQIVGHLNSVKRKVAFDELDDFVWGDYKSKTADKTIFRTTNFQGEQNDFYMETGYPSMAIIKAVSTIENLYKQADT